MHMYYTHILKDYHCSKAQESSLQVVTEGCVG